MYFHRWTELRAQLTRLTDTMDSMHESAPGRLAELEGKIIASQDSLRACEAELMRIVRWRDSRVTENRSEHLTILRSIGVMMCHLSDHTDVHGVVNEHPPAYTPSSCVVSMITPPWTSIRW